MPKDARPVVLWGFHPSHGNVVIKLTAGGRISKAEQDRRRREGWTLAIYAQGDTPTGLMMQAEQARGGR